MKRWFSFRCRSAASTFNTVRLVHLDGQVQDFDHPVSVGEITGKPPNELFLCTAAQLVCSAGVTPLNRETQLQAGHIYFVMPISTLQQDGVTPQDMVSVVKRLTARAKSVSSESVSSNTSPAGTSWNGFGSKGNSSEEKEKRYEVQNSCRERVSSWKPLLDTISESDVKEMQLFITKK